MWNRFFLNSEPQMLDLHYHLYWNGDEINFCEVDGFQWYNM